MHPHDTSYIAVPLRARDGSVRAWTLVDLVDLPIVSGHKWSLRASRYAGRTISKGTRGAARQTAILLHREILGLPRFDDGREGEHKNGDGLDNRRANLRVATHAENMQNSSSHRFSISSHRGVTYDKARRKWKAQVFLNGKAVFQARFTTEEEAAIAASSARSQLLPYSVETLKTNQEDQSEQPVTHWREPEKR